MAGQSAGLVVRVILGQGSGVLLVLGGSVMTLVTPPVGVGLEDVVDVAQRRVVDVDVVVVGGYVGHGSTAVRKSMSQPW